LIGLDAAQFNSVLQEIGGSSDASWLLDRYVGEVAEADPSKLRELLVKVYNQATPETAELLLKHVGGDAWSQLAQAIQRLPEPEDVPETELNRDDALKAFGGPHRVLAKSYYEAFAANVRGEVASADAIAENVSWITDKIPGLPPHIKHGARALGRAVTEVVQAGAGTFAESQLHQIRHGGADQARFINFLQKLDIPRDQADALADQLPQIYGRGSRIGS
jgi:hypothetical protein